MNTFADRVRGMVDHIGKGGLCLSDREGIKSMSLNDLADEFGLDVELLVDAVDLGMRFKRCGAEWEKKMRKVRKLEKMRE